MNSNYIFDSARPRDGLNVGIPLHERVERALILLAYCIELDGDVHLPLYEKLEADLEAMRRKENVRARARQRLGSFIETGSAQSYSLKEFELQLK